MRKERKQLRTIRIDQTDYEKILVLLDHINPRPTIINMVKYMVEKEIKERGEME